MSKTVIQARESETLDSIVYRATGSTDGIEELLMSDKRLSESLLFTAGDEVEVIVADASIDDTAVKQTIQLWS